jgi:hypothetical protein
LINNFYKLILLELEKKLAAGKSATISIPRQQKFDEPTFFFPFVAKSYKKVISMSTWMMCTRVIET